MQEANDADKVRIAITFEWPFTNGSVWVKLFDWLSSHCVCGFWWFVNPFRNNSLGDQIYEVGDQGDQIGRIFAYWAIVYSGQF
jgi:hypothetical protein